MRVTTLMTKLSRVIGNDSYNGEKGASDTDSHQLTLLLDHQETVQELIIGAPPIDFAMTANKIAENVLGTIGSRISQFHDFVS